MATNFAHLELEMAHFDNFYMYDDSVADLEPEERFNLLKKGNLQVSTVFENALADFGGYTLVSKNTHDFCNGDDAKLSSVALRNNGSYTAIVSGIKNKIGNLRVQVYERKTGSFYYFYILNEAFEKLKHIEIRFNLDGTPNYNTKWWKYEVESFEVLAKL